MPLSAHALLVGGIAIAAGGLVQDGAIAAWVARDGGEPQIHLARIDSHGRPGREVRLPSAGAASNVAVVWADGGWIVAWVDTRDGNGEVYATKVDRNLKQVARDERVTRAPGDASDVAVAARGPVAWLVWSDPRESPREGVADIFATTLHAADATRAGEEVRVLATARHSRSPEVAVSSEGRALVAWVEDAPTGLEGPSAAMVAELDASGRVVGSPRPLPGAAPGRATAIALASSDSGVRAVTARAGADGVTLDALRLAVDGTPKGPPWPLIDLDAPVAFDVALALAGDGLVFDDVGSLPRERRIRRAAVLW